MYTLCTTPPSVSEARTHLPEHTPPSCSLWCFSLTALSLQPPSSPGVGKGGPHLQLHSASEHIPMALSGSGRAQFYPNSLHWALWTITLLPDVGDWGSPVMSRRHLRPQRACGDEPPPGRPWVPGPSSIPGPILTAGTRAPDRVRGGSRKLHLPSKQRSEERIGRGSDLGSGQKFKAN